VFSNPECDCYGAALNNRDCCSSCDDVADRFRKKGKNLENGWYRGSYYYNG
jgi:hypothetical protein